MINFKQWCQNWRIIRQLRTQICDMNEALSYIKKKGQERSQYFMLKARYATNDAEASLDLLAEKNAENDRLRAQLLTYSDYVKTHIDKEVDQITTGQVKE